MVLLDNLISIHWMIQHLQILQHLKQAQVYVAINHQIQYIQWELVPFKHTDDGINQATELIACAVHGDNIYTFGGVVLPDPFVDNQVAPYDEIMRCPLGGNCTQIGSLVYRSFILPHLIMFLCLLIHVLQT